MNYVSILLLAKGSDNDRVISNVGETHGIIQIIKI